MSSKTSASLPSGLTLTGGIPTKSHDLAASIIFIVAYLLIVPLVVMRSLRKSSRTTILIRPAIFLVLRVGTYVVRSIQATGNYSEGLFIAEQVLLLCGFLLLLEPFTTIVQYNCYRNWTPTGKRDALSWTLRLVRLALLAAFILGIYVGAKTYDAMNDPDLASTLRSCRWANAIIALAIIVVGILLTVYARWTGASDVRRTAYLLALGTCLLVPAVYKLVFYAKPADPFSTAGKAVFYILVCLPELLATIAFFSINLATTFDVHEGAAKHAWNQRAMKGEVEAGSYVSERERRDDLEMAEETSNTEKM